MSRDPEAVLVVKMFASPEADAPATEVEAEIYRDRIRTCRTGDPHRVARHNAYGLTASAAPGP